MGGVLDLDRAGFWRRLIAYGIDYAAAYLLFQTLAALAFSATGGAVYATSSLQAARCRPEAALPAGGPAVMDFTLRVPAKKPSVAGPAPPDQIQRCDASFLGLPAGRFVSGLLVGQDGGEARMTLRVVALDPDGQPRRAWSLDLLLFPFLVLLRAVSDGLGGSPGRRLVQTRLADGRDADDRMPASPPFVRLGLRYQLFALPALPALLYPPDFSMLSGFPTLGGIVRAIGFAILVSLPGLVATLAAVVAIARGQDAYYDRWSGTQVRRLSR